MGVTLRKHCASSPQGTSSLFHYQLSPIHFSTTAAQFPSCQESNDQDGTDETHDFVAYNVEIKNESITNKRMVGEKAVYDLFLETVYTDTGSHYTVGVAVP